MFHRNLNTRTKLLSYSNKMVQSNIKLRKISVSLRCQGIFQALSEAQVLQRGKRYFTICWLIEELLDPLSKYSPSQ